MRVRVRLVRDELGTIAAGMERKAALVNGKIAHDIEADAKGRAPVDIGTLQASIVATPDGDVNWVVEVGVEYGARIEYGFNGQDSLGRTYNNPAQPYLTPAAEAHRQAHRDALRHIVEP